MAGAQTNSPSLAVRDQSIYIAYAEGMLPGQRHYPVWYGSDSGPLGEWSVTRLARDGGFPQLMLDSDGAANVLFSDNGIRYTEQLADGTLAAPDLLPGSVDGLNPLLAGDPATGTLWAAWSQFSADRNHINVLVSSRLSDGWSDPVVAVPDGDLTGLGVYDGTVHALGIRSDPDAWGGLLYTTNVGGSFEMSTISEAGGDTSSLAVDAIGRPHLVFALDQPRVDRGLWYTIGPGV